VLKTVLGSNALQLYLITRTDPFLVEFRALLRDCSFPSFRQAHLPNSVPGASCMSRPSRASRSNAVICKPLPVMSSLRFTRLYFFQQCGCCSCHSPNWLLVRNRAVHSVRDHPSRWDACSRAHPTHLLCHSGANRANPPPWSEPNEQEPMSRSAYQRAIQESSPADTVEYIYGTVYRAFSLSVCGRHFYVSTCFSIHPSIHLVQHQQHCTVLRRPSCSL